MGLKRDQRRENRPYLDWVKSRPSCVSGRIGCDPHHIISSGEGGMGMKASDYLTMPLTRDEHDDLHSNVLEWERRHGPQWKHVAKTLEFALITGVLEMKDE